MTDNKPFLSADEVRNLVRSKIKAHGSMASWCAKAGMSGGTISQISLFLHEEQKSPPIALLRFLGVDAVRKPDAPMISKIRLAAKRLAAKNVK